MVLLSCCYVGVLYGDDVMYERLYRNGMLSCTSVVPRCDVVMYECCTAM